MQVDLSSRIISVISLLVAIGAIGYVYTQHEMSGTRDELLAKFDDQLQLQAEKYATARENMDAKYTQALERQDARMESWNAQLNDAIAAVQQDANQVLTKIESEEAAAAQQRQLAFRAALDDLPQRLAAATDNGSNGGDSLDRDAMDSAAEISPPSNADVAESDAADEAPEIGAGSVLDQLADNAHLRIVTTVLKPGTGNTTLIEIENDGEEEALIDRIRFRPEAQFEFSDTTEVSPEVVDGTITTITYDDADNTSTKPGYHGIYDRMLGEPIRLPAGERLTLRVTILDSEHQGWGFAGKLVLNYNTKEVLSIDAARVAFVPSSI